MLDKLWLVLIIYIIIMGIYFTKKINFKNYEITSLLKKINKESLFLSLGTKMGVGTIIGTCASIYIGKAGSLFWMYLFTFLTSSIIYVESYLGTKYKQQVGKNYVGGIYYYTKFGLKNNFLAKISLCFFILTYSFLFLMIQTNTVKSVLKINKYILLFILCFFIILLITNEISQIIKVINKIVPIMCIFFLCISLYVIIKNINVIPSIFKDIFYSAFNTKTFLIGMIIGIKRSIFLNELLIGTTSMSSGINNEKSNETANTLILGTYFIVFIVSTLVALLILIFLKNNNLNFSSYIELLLCAFNYHYHTLGNYFLSIIICLLAISTIISGIYIGISNISYITNNKMIRNSFKIIMLLFICSGIFIDTNNIWKIVDIMMLLLIIINSYIITKLRKEIT